MAGLNRRERLASIEAQASELENSPYNVATVSQQNQDYYAKVAADYAKAKREAAYGLSPEEKAAATQTFAEGTNLGVQNAINAGGGNLQNYITANMNTNVNRFATDLSAQDAQIKRQKEQQVLAYLGQLGQASNVYQDVATQNFQKNIMAEQAIGQAEKDWYAQKYARNTELMKAGIGIAGSAIQAGAQAGIMASDQRLKENIVYSHREKGHKIYEFNYKGKPEKYSGVLAQEVLEIEPSAVSEQNGFYMVDYHKLGLTMKTVN